jgi:hypothetical protein
MKEAPFMIGGSSFCGEHVKDALKGVTWEALEMKPKNDP